MPEINDDRGDITEKVGMRNWIISSESAGRCADGICLRIMETKQYGVSE